MGKKAVIIIIVIILSVAALFLGYKLLCGNVSCSLLRPSEEKGLMDKAGKAIARGHDDEAMETLENVIVKYPESREAEKAFTSLASIYEKRGNLLKAKETYQKMVEKFPDSNDIEKLQSTLDNLNVKILFSSLITPDSFQYEVQKGDTLAKIAKRFNTTMQLIMRSNNLRNTSVQLGKKLKITKLKFSIVSDKSQNILTLKADGNIFKTYRVSTGKNFSTPVGTFTVINKIENPTWYTAGTAVPPNSPKNILGTRWLGISKPSYGIHGTTDPGSIGQQSTAGCIRMFNSEVEELYDIVPEGTEVVIVD